MPSEETGIFLFCFIDCVFIKIKLNYWIAFSHYLPSWYIESHKDELLFSEVTKNLKPYFPVIAYIRQRNIMEESKTYASSQET